VKLKHNLILYGKNTNYKTEIINMKMLWPCGDLAILWRLITCCTITF